MLKQTTLIIISSKVQERKAFLYLLKRMEMLKQTTFIIITSKAQDRKAFLYLLKTVIAALMEIRFMIIVFMIQWGRAFL